MSEKGTLLVSVTTLRGEFPVENAQVTVFKGEYKKDNEIIRVKTDQSGRTPPIILDTENKDLSESSGNKTPYTTYNIYTTAPKLISQFNMNVPIFSGVTSLQSVDLMPIGADGENTTPKVVQEAPDFNL